ncbi:Uncharacterized protein TCM_037115 [Theobroma cacao]|uniref:Uncharacterized protein n=1 Tax=Theobroma cacao TaxID=3641 RepID=A0A061GR79_THECC|nr:Uncharacterized protein TCM_037115 [Theobroma cacao]
MTENEIQEKNILRNVPEGCKIIFKESQKRLCHSCFSTVTPSFLPSTSTLGSCISAVWASSGSKSLFLQPDMLCSPSFLRFETAPDGTFVVASLILISALLPI